MVHTPMPRLSMPRLNKNDISQILLFVIAIGMSFIMLFIMSDFKLIILRILIVAAFLVVVFVVVFLSLPLWMKIMRILFTSWGTSTIDFFDVEDWSKRIAAADADTQRYMLRNIDQQKLSLNATDYLDYLKSIQPSIKEEPALSTYWELRYRLEEALRQERQG